MTDVNPIDILDELYEHAAEIDSLSKRQANVERQLEPVELEYERFVTAFEQGLWVKHLEGEKFPPEKLRMRLAHQQMPPPLLGSYTSLHAERKRIEKRISALKMTVEAKRSILSALKLEAEAAGSGLRR